MRTRGTIFLVGAVMTLCASAASANTDQAKLYKQVYGGDKPKCIACHVDKLPKKDEGKHDFNDYGKKLTAIDPHPDEAAYREAGPIPQ